MWATIKIENEPNKRKERKELQALIQSGQNSQKGSANIVVNLMHLCDKRNVDTKNDMSVKNGTFSRHRLKKEDTPYLKESFHKKDLSCVWQA